LDSSRAEEKVQPTRQPGKAQNLVFNAAVQSHVEKLSEDEKEAFKSGYELLSPDEHFSQVKEFDQKHSEDSVSRKWAEPLAQFLGVIDTLLQSSSIGI
jgi:hypothetical protein